jgi:hypothetical protein
MSSKVEYFRNELAFITNPTIKEFAETAIESLPDYFFVVPASSTGRYHPSYSLGDGGLAKHTRAAVRIAVELSRLNWWNFQKDELDLCIAALLVHDGFKSGITQTTYTLASHPTIATAVFSADENLNSMLPPEQFDIFLKLIARHMGQWNFDFKTKAAILDMPETQLEKFVHLADYLASRKCLEMNFDAEIASS